MESAIRSANKELAEAIKQDQADSARVSGGFIFSMDSPVRSIDECAIFEIQYESRFGTHHDLQLGYQLAGTVGT
jgi:hypothetical protein